MVIVTAGCLVVSPLWVIVPPLLWLLWYGPRSDRRYVAALEELARSPAPKSTSRSRTRSGARRPKRQGRTQ